MTLERHTTRRVSFTRDSRPQRGPHGDHCRSGASVLRGSEMNVIRCMHHHPLDTGRPHGATLSVAVDEWRHTDRVILNVRPADLAGLEVAPGCQLYYCPRCKAATEYCQVGKAAA